MLPATFALDHLVCEVTCPDDPPGYLWYELDWDDARIAAVNAGSLPGSTRVIAATRRGPRATVREVLPSPGPATHVQFETPKAGLARSAVAAVHDAGLIAIPAHHMTAPPGDPQGLRAAVERLAELGTALIKLVFPATEERHVRWAVALLHEWPHDRVGLSLTPSGSRQGRLHAALAGSRLVFAPRTDTEERMSASWYREHLTGLDASSR